MKRLLCGVLGLWVGGFLTTLAGGGCVGCGGGLAQGPVPIVEAGTYQLEPQSQTAGSDYKLVVSDDQTWVTETFTRSGILYENEYRITGTQEE